MTSDTVFEADSDSRPSGETMFQSEDGRPGAIDVTIVIVNYNSPDDTANAVASILENTGGYAVEIIVVDNDSSDDSVQTLRSAFPGITVIATGRNGGYAWGNNVGIARARGRYVLVLNPDALLAGDTLRNAITYMESHPDVGILGARVTFEDGRPQSSFFRFPSLTQMAWNIFVPNSLARKSKVFGDQRYVSMPRDRVVDVEVVSGCFMLVPRRVIEQVGPMNDLFFMYSEESEWCWRVKEAGYDVRYHPDVRITHIGAITTGRTSPWKAVEIAKGQILFLRISRGPAAARLATFLMLLANLVRGVSLIPVMLINPRRKKVAIWRARTAFLMRALFRQPTGQTPPQADARQA